MTSLTSQRKTVLVAADTPFVRDRFKAALQSAGHVAGTVGSASELLSRIRSGGGEIDLVVLDLRLPPAQGVALVRALRGIAGFRAPICSFRSSPRDPTSVLKSPT